LGFNHPEMVVQDFLTIHSSNTTVSCLTASNDKMGCFANPYRSPDDSTNQLAEDDPGCFAGALF
jgi:hypothetical protein